MANFGRRFFNFQFSTAGNGRPNFPRLKKSKSWNQTCSFCKSEFYCKRPRLTEDEKAALHKNNVPQGPRKFTSFPNVIVVPENEHVKITETKLVGEIAKHCPVMAIDHLSETIVSSSEYTKEGCQNPLKDIKLHKTKCSVIINNVFFQ